MSAFRCTLGFFGALLFTGLLAVAPAAQSDVLTGPRVGQPAPAFTLTTLAGARVSLSSYAGKTLVINVWATWCPPCRQETPDLIAAYAKLSRGRVAFLGVDSTEETPIVRAFAVAKGVPYPEAVDAGKAFVRAYDIQYFPTTLVIDPQGTLRARYVDVITPQILARLTSAAARGQDAVFSSLLQRKIDARLKAPAGLASRSSAVRLAAAIAVSNAIDTAEDLLAQSDPAGGETVDLLRTRVEEAAVRDRAIAALVPLERSSPRAAFRLARLRGDAATDREAWAQAFAAYRRADALDRKDIEALQGEALAASRLNHLNDAIAADARLVSLQPDAVDARVDLGLAYAEAGHFAQAYRIFDRAVALATQQRRAHPRDAKALRLLAWVHLYAGRTYAKGGDHRRARREFMQVSALALQLPAHDERHDMYLEEAQEALVALDVVSGTGRTSLNLSPWTGAVPTGSLAGTIRYRLIVTGGAGERVSLHAKGVPPRWVASFCSDRLCAPFAVTLVFPESGILALEFQLVPPVSGAKVPHVVINASGGTMGRTAAAST